MKNISIIYCLLLTLCVGCNEVNPKGEEEVRKFVKEWNDAHTQIQSPYLERNYMDVVTYYEKELTRNQVQQDKNLLFQQFPDFTQRIVNDELDITKVGVSYVVKFTKRVYYSGIEADYSSYLSVSTKNGVFKILREGVDKNNKDLDAPIFPSVRKSKAFIPNNRKLYGDFNGDGLSDYANVISPEIISTTNGDTVMCKGECNSVIIFSNKNLKAITINDAYQSQLENLKDLNNDGADEIGFWDIKPTTKTLYVFNPSNSNMLCEPIVINTVVHKNLNLIDVFKKTGPNKITVTSSAKANGKWVLKTKVITLD